MLWAERSTPPSAASGPPWAYLLLSAGYVISGKLGLLLAVPPGYATAIFPPAGIAVAAVFMAGPPTLPWIFLGSLVLNLWVGYSVHQQFDAIGSAVAVIIAGASMLQAGIAGSALRRAIGYPTALDNVRDLSRFFLVAPLCCLISASLSLAGMAALGALKTTDFTPSWVTWWIGDTLGVLLVLPLVLIAAGEPKALWRGRGRSVALPMLLLFALFVGIYARVSLWEREQSLLEFRLLSQQVVDKIRSGLEEQGVFLEQLERAFSGQRTVSRQDFRRLVERLPQRFPTIRAVEWAPRIEAGQRAQFEDLQRRNFPGFEIREIDPPGGLRRAGERPEFYPVTYVEPLEGNAQAAGLDLASNPDRRAALATAIEKGAVSATAPIRLIQEPADQVGMLLVAAVRDGPNGSGVLLVALRVDVFVQAMLGPMRSTIDLRLIDTDQGKPLFDGFSSEPGDTSFEQAFSFGTRRFLVRTEPTAAYRALHRGWQSFGVLAVGVFGTGLLGALLMLGTGQAHRFEALLETRTRDLQKSNERLKLEIEERQNAEAALRHAQRLEAIGQLTGGIAHDFNNLLMIVNGGIHRLRRDLNGEKYNRLLDMITTATQRGETLTRQLLTFSRRQTLSPRVIDLAKFAPDLAEILKRSLRGDIEVKLDVPQTVCAVNVDLAELELAILNLGVNARDAMPAGGTLTLAIKPVRLTGETGTDGLSGAFVAILMADTGTGIPAEILPRVFEPFFTTKEVGKGTGLGLSQVHGFAKQSGGTVTVSSNPERGTTITLYLPCSTERPQPMVVVDTGEIFVPGGGIVLVVEDNADVATVCTEHLEELGFRVKHSPSARAALDFLKDNDSIDLVLSDILMPGGMNGLELAHLLREQRPNLPVVLITGYSGNAEDAARHGFKVLRKPFDVGALAKAVQEVVGTSWTTT